MITGAGNSNITLDIAHFEQEHGLTLPLQYKDAVVQGRFGRFRHWMFEFTGTDGHENESNIDGFFSFMTDDAESVAANYRFYVSSGRLPAHAVPIAQCLGGNLICIDLRADRYGTICYWDHEFELVLDASTILAPVAQDLGEFLDMLQPDE